MKFVHFQQKKKTYIFGIVCKSTKVDFLEIVG